MFLACQCPKHAQNLSPNRRNVLSDLRWDVKGLVVVFLLLLFLRTQLSTAKSYESSEGTNEYEHRSRDARSTKTQTCGNFIDSLDLPMPSLGPSRWFLFLCFDRCYEQALEHLSTCKTSRHGPPQMQGSPHPHHAPEFLSFSKMLVCLDLCTNLLVV